MPGVPNGHPDSLPYWRKICSVKEPGEHEVIKDGTMLEDCGTVEVEMRNGEVDVKYEKDGEVVWIPVVRKKKTEESNSSWHLNVLMDLNKERKKNLVVLKFEGISRINVP